MKQNGWRGLLKIGVIGVGSIAKKAYLPIYAAMSGDTIHFCTRNPNTLDMLKQKYRFKYLYQDLNDLINSGIEAAFVHAATAAHPLIIEQLIRHHIAVFTDKPIADNYQQSRRLTELAKQEQVPLMTGFNRRFAPFYQQAAKLEGKTFIILQKNRTNDPLDLRPFIFGDFIHVIDSVRFIAGEHQLKKLSVHATKNGENKYTSLTAAIQFENCSAIAVMNRVSGTNEELLQVMSPEGEYRIRNLTDCRWIKSREEVKLSYGDWDTTLYKRGFETAVSAFLKTVKDRDPLLIPEADALETHHLCELLYHEASY